MDSLEAPFAAIRRRGFHHPTFLPSMRMESDEAKKIYRRRKEALHTAFNIVKEYYATLHLRAQLDEATVESTIREYEILREEIKRRLGIEKRIQRPKIAGLMAAAIMKERPVILNDHDHSPVTADWGKKANAVLAFWHAIGICSEDLTQDKARHLTDTSCNPHFETWMQNLIAYLTRSPDGDGLYMIFETLAMAYFPHNLNGHQ